jgi:hypothetical protein
VPNRTLSKIGKMVTRRSLFFPEAHLRHCITSNPFIFIMLFRNINHRPLVIGIINYETQCASASLDENKWRSDCTSQMNWSTVSLNLEL